ncbi:MAG: 50S ribosomal protein L4 [Humidesulfovibrio sp.]|jgi:large subunit ribosomal protein L4|uniref:50S ribosomal protein L4 n=1 Tax=Humidesulfovibrio sp. TaxID=2910988 RepID=UPI0027F9C52C|nr:50S ribosomal protein L4 [Humidesulfovibrio sp.]MDQ7833964.1 50S ribosomal protein L4 [Humidesulfovibrio sp.]
MATVTVFDQSKKEVGSLDLSPEIFEVEVRPEIMHLVVRAQLAAKRVGTHATKTRAFVSGGGKKPWKQKGTGHARAGSSRSPIWRGGAIIFGPSPRSYEFKVNRKVRRLALKMALSARLSEDNLLVLKGIDLPDVKTKRFAEVAKTLGLEKALIVFKEVDNNLLLSARNLPGIKLLPADKLNAYDVLLYPKLVMLESAAVSVQERLK